MLAGRRDFWRQTSQPGGDVVSQIAARVGFVEFKVRSFNIEKRGDDRVIDELRARLPPNRRRGVGRSSLRSHS
jgi:hypothetical protein